jgi:CHASE2 domain-containing sensor protein
MTGPSWRILAIPRLRTLSFWLNPASLMVASLLAVLTLYGLDVRILELIELKTYDLRFVSRGRRRPPRR